MMSPSMVLMMLCIISSSLMLFDGCEAKKPPPVKRDGSLLLLDDENFKAHGGRLPSLLVVFYAPWCHHCKELFPELSTAAHVLESQGAHIALIDGSSTVAPSTYIDGKRDLTEEEIEGFVPGVRTAEEYGVKTYPTMMLFHYGRHNTMEMNFPRNAAALIERLSNLVRPVVTELKSSSDVERLISEQGHKLPIVFGFFSSLNAVAQLKEQGEIFRGMGVFAYTVEKKTIDHFNASDHLVIFRPGSVLAGPGIVTTPSVDSKKKKLKKKKKSVTKLPPPFTLRNRPENEPPTQLELKSYMPKLITLYGEENMDEITVFDRGVGTIFQRGFGQEQYNRDAMTRYVAQHSFPAVNVLTRKNKHVYNQRSAGLVLMFLQGVGNVEDGVLAKDTGKTCDQEQQGGDGGGDESVACSSSGASDNTPPADMKYYANRFLKLSKVTEFSNYSFLFVDPLLDPQVFESFGYSASDFYQTTEEIRRSGGKAFSGKTRNNLVGVAAGGEKYRFPYDYFDFGLTKKFLEDINQNQLRPYVRSLAIPQETGEAGSGRVTEIVHDNFLDGVPFDFEHETLILFASTDDDVSKQAVGNIFRFAKAEEGNQNLIVGLYDAVRNDPPTGIEFDSVPQLYYFRRDAKRIQLRDFSTPIKRKLKHYHQIKAGKETVTGGSGGASKKKDERATERVLDEAFDALRSLAVLYKGDFSLASIARFAKENAGVRLKGGDRVMSMTSEEQQQEESRKKKNNEKGENGNGKSRTSRFVRQASGVYTAEGDNAVSSHSAAVKEGAADESSYSSSSPSFEL